MNASIGFAALTLDPHFCGRLCLTLAHSLWQMALLAVLAAVVSHLWKRHSAETSYAVHVAALLLGLAALPMTFALVDVAQRSFSPINTSVGAESFPADVRLGTLPGKVEQTVVNLPMESVPDSLPEAISVQQADWWLDLSPWLLAVYAIGVAVMILRLAVAFWRSYQLASHAKAITNGPLFDLLQTLARQWSVRVVPTLAQAEQIVVPQVVGFLKPTILLPTSAITGLTISELEMILAHELAHVRRLDMWIHLVQRLAEAVLFFNPALWILSRRISTLREYCCDDQTCLVADRESFTTRLCYAQALLRVMELSGRQYPQAELTALAATGRCPSELRRRVARLFGEPLPEPVRISRGGLLAIFAGAVLLAAVPLTWQTAAEHIVETPIESQISKDNTDTASEFSVGGKLELLGIGTYDEKPTRWWDENGELLQKVNFKGQIGSVTPAPNYIARQLVFQIKGLPKNAVVKWSIFGNVMLEAGEVVLNEEAIPPDNYSKAFVIPATSKSFDLRVGVAIGGWETITKTKSPRAVSMGFADGNNIAFSGSLLDEEGAVIVASHTFRDQNVRVLAIDSTGKTHRAARYDVNAVGDPVLLTKWTYRNLKPEQIDHFEFQTRDYEWVEINDLPVNPREKSAKDKTAMTKESEVSIENSTQKKQNSQTKIAVLQELVDSFKAEYQRVKRLQEVGQAGDDGASLALYQLSIARAQLASAEGIANRAIQEYEIAVKATETLVKVREEIYKSGKVTLEALLQATIQRSQAKLELIEAREKLASQKR